MNFLVAAALFMITLQPNTGVGGGPIHIQVEARDSDTARRQVRAQYKNSYRISDVRRVK